MGASPEKLLQTKYDYNEALIALTRPGAMYITGFAESIAEVLNLSNIWAVQGISMGVLLGLLGINLAGVKWIIRLQLLLLAVLAVSALDFVVGTFSHLDPVHGFVGYSEELLRNNTLPDYTPGESFFSVFGVFFPAATGVMAGFNMSGDLQKPAINIPVGSLAAIGISVSLVGFLFLLGLYISSLASCMGGLYGAPRILQCIAQEKVIPILGVLGQGRGPNKTPVAAICLTSLITMAFIFIGQVNVLASIVTINFMLTYSTIDYSYFCVSMSYDLQMKQRRLLPKEESRTRNPSKPLIFGRHSDYGTDGMAKNRRNGTLLEFTKDMDQIFQTVDPDVENKEREREKKEKESKSWRTRKPAKQTLMDSFRLDLERSAASVKDCAKTSDTESVNCSEAGAAANSAQEEQDLMAQAFDSQEQQPVSVVLESDPRNDKAESAFQRQSSRDRDDSQEDFTAEQRLQRTEIQEKPISFYSRLCNHWVSLVGAISSLMIMFVIQWIYAFVNIGMAILLYFYIGKVSPGLPPATGQSGQSSTFADLESWESPSQTDSTYISTTFTRAGERTLLSVSMNSTSPYTGVSDSSQPAQADTTEVKPSESGEGSSPKQSEFVVTSTGPASRNTSEGLIESTTELSQNETSSRSFPNVTQSSTDTTSVSTLNTTLPFTSSSSKNTTTTTSNTSEQTDAAGTSLSSSTETTSSSSSSSTLGSSTLESLPSSSSGDSVTNGTQFSSDSSAAPVTDTAVVTESSFTRTEDYAVTLPHTVENSTSLAVTAVPEVQTDTESPLDNSSTKLSSSGRTSTNSSSEEPFPTETDSTAETTDILATTLGGITHRTTISDDTTQLTSTASPMTTHPYVPSTTEESETDGTTPFTTQTTFAPQTTGGTSEHLTRTDGASTDSSTSPSAFYTDGTTLVFETSTATPGKTSENNEPTTITYRTTAPSMTTETLSTTTQLTEKATTVVQVTSTKVLVTTTVTPGKCYGLMFLTY
ncbi:UNVERIFIED_CONTAM: hypothetical protein FKN15_044148 [Acipenser sinensis]